MYFSSNKMIIKIEKLFFLDYSHAHMDNFISSNVLGCVQFIRLHSWKWSSSVYVVVSVVAQKHLEFSSFVDSLVMSQWLWWTGEYISQYSYMASNCTIIICHVFSAMSILNLWCWIIKSAFVFFKISMGNLKYILVKHLKIKTDKFFEFFKGLYAFLWYSLDFIDINSRELVNWVSCIKIGKFTISKWLALKKNL